MLDVRLPGLPPVWQAAFGEPGYRLACRDPGGNPVETNGAHWVAGMIAATVTVAAGACTPILAWLDGPAVPAELYPAGAIVPLDVQPKGMIADLCFEQGAAAWTLWQLLGPVAAIDTDRLDMVSLARKIRDTGQGDPWRVDLETLIVSVIAGDPVVRRRETVAVAAPGTSTLAWDDPFAPPLTEGGVPVDTPVGFHRLYTLDTEGGWTGSALDLWVDPRETIWIERPGVSLPAPPRSRAGPAPPRS